MDLMLSDLEQMPSLGSFGCGVFVFGAEKERSFRVLVVIEMVLRHHEENRR